MVLFLVSILFPPLPVFPPLPAEKGYDVEIHGFPPPGSLRIEGAVLACFIRREMTHDQVSAILGPGWLSHGGIGGHTVCWPWYDVDIDFLRDQHAWIIGGPVPPSRVVAVQTYFFSTPQQP